MKGGAKIEDPLPAPILVSAQVKSRGTPWPDPFGPVGQRAACLATLSQLSCSQDPWQEKTGDGTKARLRDAGTNCPRAQPHRECGQRGSGRKRRRQAQVCAQSRDASGLLHRGRFIGAWLFLVLSKRNFGKVTGPPTLDLQVLWPLPPLVPHPRIQLWPCQPLVSAWPCPCQGAEWNPKQLVLGERLKRITTAVLISFEQNRLPLAFSLLACSWVSDLERVPSSHLTSTAAYFLRLFPTPFHFH